MDVIFIGWKSRIRAVNAVSRKEDELACVFEIKLVYSR